MSFCAADMGHSRLKYALEMAVVPLNFVLMFRPVLELEVDYIGSWSLSGWCWRVVVSATIVSYVLLASRLLHTRVSLYNYSDFPLASVAQTEKLCPCVLFVQLDINNTQWWILALMAVGFLFQRWVAIRNAIALVLAGEAFASIVEAAVRALMWQLDFLPQWAVSGVSR
jgi:hypothetical protein